MPPTSGLMPQPWPTVSADQTKLTSPLAGRRHAEAAGHRLAHGLEVAEVEIGDAIEDRLARRHAADAHARGEVGGFERQRALDALGVGEALGRGVLHDHARRPVGRGSTRWRRRPRHRRTARPAGAAAAPTLTSGQRRGWAGRRRARPRRAAGAVSTCSCAQPSANSPKRGIPAAWSGATKASCCRARPHGESGLVASLLTRAHGRHAGFVPGGVLAAGRARSGSPAMSSRSAGGRACRSSSATITGELREPHAARALDDAVELAGLVRRLRRDRCGAARARAASRDVRRLPRLPGRPRPSRLAGDLRPAGARAPAGAGLRPRPREVRRDGRDRGSGLRLAQDRPGGVAGGRRPLQGEAARAAGLSVHRRVAGR